MSDLAKPEPALPPLAVAAFVVTVAGAAALTNCAILAALLKRIRTGLYSIIIQLAIADLILVTSIGTELWSTNAKTWYFGNFGCIVYQGLDVFASTASLYLVAAIGLHTLATITLEDKVNKRRHNRNRDEEEEIRSSQHSLVANSDSSTPPRTMNLDYRLTDTTIPVTLPTVFVWVLSASLSVPELILASTVSLKKDIIKCILDVRHRVIAQSLLAVFILFLPLLILSTVTALIIVKLKSKKSFPEIDNCESVAALRLSLWLIILYVILGAPRSIIGAYSVYSASMSESPLEILQQNSGNAVITLTMSGAYLMTALIRPLLYIFFLPTIRKVFSVTSSI